MRYVAVLAALVFVASAAAGGTAEHRNARAGAGVYRVLAQHPAHVLVALRTGGSSARSLAAERAPFAAARAHVLQRVTARDFRLERSWSSIPVLAATITRHGLDELLASPDVRRVDLDPPVHAELARSVPFIRADQVQAIGVTGRGVTVAVLDTGIDTDNPDLIGDIVGQKCFAQNADGSSACAGGADSAEDDNGHGTAVAGIITSNGANASKGVAPDAKIVAVKVLGSDGRMSSSIPVLSALDWIVDNRPDVKIVNLSLGTNDLLSGDCDSARADAIAYASVFSALRSRGVSVFAASGNEASSTAMASPACVSPAISVGAVYDDSFGGLGWTSCTDASTARDQIACFSDSDPALDLLAPGALITAPKLGGGTGTTGGTSDAAPHAAGVAALLLQARPDLTPDQIRAALQQTGVRITDARNGVTTSRLDALAAFNFLGSLPQSPPPTYLPAGSASFVDPTGDDGGGPDVTGVQVTSSANGILTFYVLTPNRPALASGDSVQVVVNSDRNTSTGDMGADVALAVFFGETYLYRWNGSDWTLLRRLADASFSASALVVHLSENELGATGDFGFRVETYQGDTLKDQAPANRFWPFPAVALGVAKTGSGAGTVSATDLLCGTTCSANYARNEAVTLTATPDAGSVFAEWSGACGGTAGCTVTMDSAKTVTARFEALRKVIVSTTGLGSVSSTPAGIDCTDNCEAQFPNGTTVTLNATPNEGAAFRGWGGACSGTGPCVLTLGADVSVTATFADVQAPSVKAIAGSARAGRRTKLRFRLSDNSGAAKATVTVLEGKRRLATLVRPLGDALGAVYAVSYTPSRKTAGRLEFCVRAVDAAGNAARQSCAALTVH
jgi:subtilisin family serine protease